MGLLDLPVTLDVPFHPWKADYDALARDPDAAPHLVAARGALEAPGAPEDRLASLARAIAAARVALASRGPGPIASAVDRVALDLHVAFYKDLAAAVGQSDAPVAERLSALERLKEMVAAPAPVGVPGPRPTSAWGAFARDTAATEVDVWIETLRGG